MQSRTPADTGREVSDVQGQFRVMEERETPRGWSYRVVVGSGEEKPTEHEVTLSWVDHNYWCGGTQAPSVTAERVLEELLRAIDSAEIVGAFPARFGEELPARFDLSLARRLVRGLDASMRRAG